MLTRTCIFLVIAINVVHISFGNEHIYGEIQAGNLTLFSLCFENLFIIIWCNAGDKILFEKELFDRNETTPKNFSIIFKYIASRDSPNITYSQINVRNGVSSHCTRSMESN